MREVFVDTAAWLALLNTNDYLHDAAQQEMDKLRQEFVVMGRARITEAFTSDRHFEQAGYSRSLLYP
jgi:predicted nucleic acid-binding protein